jgi:diaminopimelate epimerase
MHGLGNDFVVFDFRNSPFELTEKQVINISDRNKGVGCDQLITISKSEKADAFMNIYNADGSKVEACGNATRCIGHLLIDEMGKETATIETNVDILIAKKAGDKKITVNMGKPRLNWNEIPLSKQVDTSNIELNNKDVKKALAVSMGNPHLVCFVDDAEDFDVANVGARYETHPLFPEKTNVEFANLVEENKIRMRVWERGAGITKACGTGSCATLVAAVRAGFCKSEAKIILDGGQLFIKWGEDGNIYMTGEVAIAFRGTLDESILNI